MKRSILQNTAVSGTDTWFKDESVYVYIRHIYIYTHVFISRLEVVVWVSHGWSPPWPLQSTLRPYFAKKKSLSLVAP